MRPHSSNPNPPDPDQPSPGSDDSVQNTPRSFAHQASQLAEHGSCSAMLAHEINNLMTQVGGRSQLAMMHMDNPELIRKALELACRASTQIAHLTELLGSSTPTTTPTATPTITPAGANTPTSVRHPSPLRDIHEQAIGYLSDADIARFGFTIEESGESIPIQCPPYLLQQVLLNLYINAIHAIEHSATPESGQIKAVVERIEPDLNCSTWNIPMIRISIEDTGIGMNPEQIEQIRIDWQRGGPLDSTDQNRSPSTPRRGLGLMVCNTLLGELNGTIDIQSTPGQGTKMILTLPTTAQREEINRAA